MAVRIRLLRMGKIRNPQYRIVIADSRVKRDGRAIEYVGLYHPKEEPSRIEVNSERVQHWLSVGAQPSEPVVAILSKTGDWQKYKGLPPPTEPLKVAPARADRTAAYEVEAKAAAGIAETETKPRQGKKAAKAAEPKATAESKPEPKPEPEPEPKADTKTEAKVDAEAPAAAAAPAQESADAGADAQG